MLNVVLSFLKGKAGKSIATIATVVTIATGFVSLKNHYIEHGKELERVEQAKNLAKLQAELKAQREDAIKQLHADYEQKLLDAKKLAKKETEIITKTEYVDREIEKIVVPDECVDIASNVTGLLIDIVAVSRSYIDEPQTGASTTPNENRPEPDAIVRGHLPASRSGDESGVSDSRVGDGETSGGTSGT